MDSNSFNEFWYISTTSLLRLDRSKSLTIPIFFPFKELFKFSSKSGMSLSKEVVSFSSWEHISFNMKAQSSAVLAIGPA